MDFNAISTSFHYAIQNYAYDLRPSSTGIEARMQEHFHSVPAYAYRVLTAAVYRAGDALREYVDAVQRLTDYEREYGPMDEIEALWREAGDRETEVYALIASVLGYGYDFEADEIIVAE